MKKLEKMHGVVIEILDLQELTTLEILLNLHQQVLEVQKHCMLTGQLAN